MFLVDWRWRRNRIPRFLVDWRWRRKPGFQVLDLGLFALVAQLESQEVQSQYVCGGVEIACPWSSGAGGAAGAGAGVTGSC